MSTLSNISNISTASSSSTATSSGFDHDPFSASSSPWSSPDHGPIEEITDPPPVIPGLPESAIAEIKAVFDPPIGAGGLPIMRINPAWSSPPVSGTLGKK